MALKALNPRAQQAHQTILSHAQSLHNLLTERGTRWNAAGTANWDQVYLTHWDVRNRVQEIERMLTAPELAAYAATQDADPGYDFVAEATAVAAAGRALMLEIRTRIPDRSGEVIAPDGESVNFTQVTGADLTAILNQIQNVRALIT